MTYDTMTNDMRVRARAEKVFAAIEQDVTPYDCVGTFRHSQGVTKVYHIVGATVTTDKGDNGRAAFVDFDDGRKMWVWINASEEYPYCSITFERR